MLPKHTGSVIKLASLAERGKLPEGRPERIIQNLPTRCIVDKLTQIGLLADIKNFSIAADGSCYNSEAGNTGAKVCDCRSKGFITANAPNRYSDLDVRWVVIVNEQSFYGDTLFNTTASDSSNNLTIYLRIGQGQRHDSILLASSLCLKSTLS